MKLVYRALRRVEEEAENPRNGGMKGRKIRETKTCSDGGTMQRKMEEWRDILAEGQKERGRMQQMNEMTARRYRR